MIDLKADQDEIKEVLGNEYQYYNLERYQQTDIHRIANVDSKVIIYLFNKDANHKLLETKERCYFFVFGRYRKRNYILDCTSQRS